MSRIDRLAGMAHKDAAAVIEEVWDLQKNRQDHRRVLVSEEEYRSGLRDSRENGASADKLWLIQDDKERWIGPLSLGDLLLNPYFMMSRRVKNLQEHIEARASEFPVIREAVRGERHKKPAAGPGRNFCPRCRLPLGDFFYEGVPVKVCRQCLGKLVEASAMERILARREFTFSPELIKKAEDFKRQFLTNPIKAQKLKDKESPPGPCPSCGYRLVSRPYNYQFFLPVEKCLACNKIWFDEDELEMLQVLIEKP
jgi:Zn-finger nucleic acid-binding protein